MKRLGLIISLLIVVFIGFAIVYLFASKVNEMNDFNPSKYYINKEFSGVVKNKFINKKQHNQQIIILENRKIKDTIIFNFVMGEVYEFIKIGDTLSKKRNSLDLHLKGNDVDTIIQMKIYKR